MLPYVLRRVVWAAVVFLAITFCTYILFYVIPQPQRGFSVRGRQVTNTLGSTTGINGPIWQEYGQFLWRIVSHGSLGQSWSNLEPVNSRIGHAVPVTASLLFGGAIIWLLLAFPIGIFSAMRPRSLLDRAGMIFVLIGISAHPLWIGLILAYVFGFRLHLTPISGYCDFVYPTYGTNCGGPVQWAYHLLLPWLTFALLFAALYARMVRATVVETLQQDYVQTARAKGASEWRVLRGHVLRNAMLPVVTMIGMDVGLAFAGSLFIETVYNLPGLGRLTFLSLRRQDLPMLMGVIIVVTTAILLFNLVVDLVYGWLDPRVGLSSTSAGGGRKVRSKVASPTPSVAPSVSST